MAPVFVQPNLCPTFSCVWRRRVTWNTGGGLPLHNQSCHLHLFLKHPHSSRCGEYSEYSESFFGKRARSWPERRGCASLQKDSIFTSHNVWKMCRTLGCRFLVTKKLWQIFFFNPKYLWWIYFNTKLFVTHFFNAKSLQRTFSNTKYLWQTFFNLEIVVDFFFNMKYLW